MSTMDVLYVIFLWISHVTVVTASVGDTSWVFRKCLRDCESSKCSRISDLDYAAKQPFYLRWQQWTCTAECDYQCMWKTVEAFEMDNSPVPQFHGKWPFVRWNGVQEPASCLFSLLNGLAHVIMLLQFRKKVPSSAPMYYVWHVYAVIAVNAWVWATVFHARDFPSTEMLDYISAVSLVTFSFFALIARVLGSKKILVGACGAALFSFFTHHSHYLAFVRFDYGYNMKVAITMGSLNAAGWLLWCYRMREQLPYVRKGAVAVFLVSFLVLLELGDFRPILWTFDAHSLWHAGTAPIPILWYSFIIDDCLYLEKQNKQKQPSESSGKSESAKESTNVNSESSQEKKVS